MNVIVSSGGRFHMFDLASQLQKRGVLQQLYTGYPRWKIKDIDRNRITCFLWPFIWEAAAAKYSLPRPNNFSVHDVFDRRVASCLKPCEVFHALSSWGYHSRRIAKTRFSAVTVCDRGSAHILTQRDLLREEFEQVGIAKAPIPPEMVERELEDYEEADFIWVPSQFCRRTFIEHEVPQEKVHVCPYGVDLSLFRPLPKADNHFRVLFVGTYSVQKGIDYLFQALRPLVKAGQLEVWLVGGPSTEVREILHRSADLFIDKGFQPRDKLSWFYSQGSVLILPSIQEGFGLVLAQAMACGVPVIATTNTGAEDLFTDGSAGFIVPIRDPQAIREKVQWMLDNPVKRQEMGEIALRHVKDLGGWDSYGRRAVDLYKQYLRE